VRNAHARASERSSCASDLVNAEHQPQHQSWRMGVDQFLGGPTRQLFREENLCGWGLFLVLGEREVRSQAPKRAEAKRASSNRRARGTGLIDRFWSLANADGDLLTHAPRAAWPLDRPRMRAGLNARMYRGRPRKMQVA
jgi:hypothetical protein